jgi:hypothetical protein
MVNMYIWERMEFYATSVNKYVCILGDFNAIVSLQEKWGGSRTLTAHIKAFNSMLI